MRQVIFLFLVFTTTLFSNQSSQPQELASLHGESSALVYGCVNAITGDLFIDQMDYVVKGAEPIRLPRRYISLEAKNSNLRFRFSNHLTAGAIRQTFINVFVPEPTGIQLAYPSRPGDIQSDGKKLVVECPLKLRPMASLFSSGFVNHNDSAYHPMNNTVLWDMEKGILKVLHADGSYCIYNAFDEVLKRFDPLGVNIKSETQLKLTYERLANGNFIRYGWGKKKNTPVIETITTYSPQSALLAEVKVNTDKEDEILLTTSDSQSLKYKSIEYKKFVHLASVTTPQSPEETLIYNDRHLLKEKRYPEERSLQIQYNKDNTVKGLIGPEGPICTFEYLTGLTEVTHSDGNKTRYYYDPKSLRLTRIETLQGADKRLKTETFTWDSFGNLLTKETSGETPLLATTFTYDEFGKVKSKTIKGAITSIGAEDNYTTTYKYNEQNFLIEEAEENGLVTTYTYFSDTNLPASKILSKNGTILKRTFYDYDDHHFLICETTDDGPNFSERHITRITPRYQQPFFGLPQIIEEYYDDNGSEVLLKKIHLEYDRYGHLTKKTIYDSEQNPYYTETTVYNQKGQIEEEIDADGNKTTYRYDINGNLVEEISLSGLKTTYEYDRLNRCVTKAQENYITRYSSYTLLGEPKAITDPLKGITHFTYDPLGNPTSQTDPFNHTTTFTSNALGQQENVTDPLGNTTRTKYNIFGNPLVRTYPDGTQECYTYTLDGKVETYTDQNNTTTIYTYDDFGNIIQEEVTHNGELLTTTQRRFNAFHLLEEIDSEGLTTTYQYDPSGRLRTKTIGTLVITYDYDTLGRCTHETSFDYTIEKTYDNLNRVITQKEYSNSTLLTQENTTYDAASNIKTHTTYPENQEATTSYNYDVFGREIACTNPLGEITTTAYILDNDTLKKSIYEPGDIEIIETTNTLNQTTCIEKRHQSVPIARSRFEYDSCGNLKCHTTTIFREAIPSSSHSVTYIYDTMQRKISETESNLKTTIFTYTPKGELFTLTKPDGVTLHYTYTPLGYLSNLFSSDQTIHYTFTYNTKGDLLSSIDHVHNMNTKRLLDSQGNILEETLGNDMTLRNEYDPLNRRTLLQLPNGKIIHYTHEGTNLKTVHFDNFTHNYTYDLASNPIQEECINQTLIQKHYDLLSRPDQLDAPNFSQTCTYNPRCNITEMTYRKRPQTYEYDPHDHLISEPYHHYTYDSLHNRTSKDEFSYVLNTLNQIEKTSKNTYQYDPNGNLISFNGFIFEYDALDRLTQVTTPTHTITYTYDAQHRRLKKNKHAYIWDDQHELGKPSRYRILGATPRAEIGSAIAIVQKNTLYIPTHDLQGNLILLTDLSDQRCEERTFTAFGECLSSLDTPWGFCSKRHDPETDLVYFGRRYYDPSTGRFITSDPEGYTDSHNLYAYCNNNPLTCFDPYGLMMIGIIPHLSEKDQENFKQRFLGGTKAILDSMQQANNQFSGNAPKSLTEALQDSPTSNPFDDVFSQYLHADFDNPNFQSAYKFVKPLADFTLSPAPGGSAAILPKIPKFASRLLPSMKKIASRETGNLINKLSRKLFQKIRMENSAQKACTTKENIKILNYHPRIRIRALQDPVAHNFPYSFDKVILKVEPIRQPNGTLLYKKTGTLNGQKGFFEIALDPKKREIFHRTFIKE